MLEIRSDSKIWLTSYHISIFTNGGSCTLFKHSPKTPLNIGSLSAKCPVEYDWGIWLDRSTRTSTPGWTHSNLSQQATLLRRGFVLSSLQTRKVQALIHTPPARCTEGSTCSKESCSEGPRRFMNAHMICVKQLGMFTIGAREVT